MRRVKESGGPGVEKTTASKAAAGVHSRMGWNRSSRAGTASLHLAAAAGGHIHAPSFSPPPTHPHTHTHKCTHKNPSARTSPGLLGIWASKLCSCMAHSARPS